MILACGFGLVLSLASALPAASQGAGPLTLDDAIGIALRSNPTYRQQLTDVNVARSALRSAYGSLIPSLTAGAGFGYTAPGELRYQSQGLGEQPEYYSSDYSLRLAYQINGSTLLQPSLERSRLEATERRVIGQEAQLVSEVTRQYLLVLQSRERLAQAEREVARTAEHVRLAEGKLGVGAGTPLDVRRAEVQQGQAEVRLVQAEHTAATEVLRLSQLLGTTLPEEVELVPEFTIFEPAWSTDELLGRARANNPALLAAHANEDASETSARAARSQFGPTLNFGIGLSGSVYQAGNVEPLVRQQLGQMQASYGSCLSQNEIRTRVGMASTPCVDPASPAVEAQLRETLRDRNRGFPFDYAQQPVQASVSISLPLFTGLNRRHQVQVARAGVENARHQVRAEELRIQQEVTAGVLGLRAAHRTALLQQRVRDSAEEELRLATQRFRFGAATSVEVTDAQTNLAQAEIDQIEAVYNFHQSLAALEALVGESLR